jgi:hypothetical protein
LWSSRFPPTRIIVSHDEYGWFAARGARGLEAALEFLEAFGVRKA